MKPSECKFVFGSMCLIYDFFDVYEAVVINDVFDL